MQKDRKNKAQIESIAKHYKTTLFENSKRGSLKESV
jgi:hypothetical protein